MRIFGTPKLDKFNYSQQFPKWALWHTDSMDKTRIKMIFIRFWIKKDFYSEKIFYFFEIHVSRFLYRELLDKVYIKS
jgi:hypothetical protein